MPTAERLVAELDALNEERKLLQATQVELLMGEAQRQHQDGAGAVFVGSCEAHFGVLGIVAAKISEQTGLPTFCWAECTPGVARGSARSPKGQSAEGLLKSVTHLLSKHGGHAAAAGFEFDPVNADRRLTKRSTVAVASASLTSILTLKSVLQNSLCRWSNV